MNFLIILVLAGMFVMLHAIFTAETGYEDESGFHLGAPRRGTCSDRLFTTSTAPRHVPRPKHLA